MDTQIQILNACIDANAETFPHQFHASERAHLREIALPQVAFSSLVSGSCVFSGSMPHMHRTPTHPIPSHLVHPTSSIPSHQIPSYPIISHHIPSYLIPSHPIPSRHFNRTSALISAESISAALSCAAVPYHCAVTRFKKDYMVPKV